MDNLNDICLGIDFGTTNSCISIWYKNKSIIIPDCDGSGVIPTIIEINSEKKIIGKEAYLRKNIFEKTNDDKNNKQIFLIYEIKKLLGKKYSELNLNEFNLLAYELKSDENDNIIIYDSNNNKSFYPEEISTHIFMSLKLCAEKYLSVKFETEIIIRNAVVTVPAYFNKNQRQIIKNSAEYADLNVIRLINEPTSAAICYGLGKNSSTNNLNIIVFDFGGGTLDVSLLNINDGVYEVLGSCGNNNLGGSDFDKKIMEYCIMEFIKKNNLDYKNFIDLISENSLQKLKYLCEQSKITLSEHNNTKIIIDNFYENFNLNINFSRDIFNKICEDLIRVIIQPINDLLENCELSKSQIDEIIMVGGMTRVPIIKYNIEKFFNKDINCSINPDTVVSIGAAIHGFMLINKTMIQDKLLLIDRTVLSIGVETNSEFMDIIIPKNTIIPIKKSKKYTTDTDFIENITIKIYEGERKFTKDNILIGEFILSGIQKEKRGIPEIQITFEIDTDGIIRIKAEDLNNPLNKKYIQVSGNKKNLTQEQIDEIILNAKLMDQKDKIDKFKKESYLSLIDSSNKILENIITIEIPLEIKEIIKNNLDEILLWLNNTKYQDIDIEKYKELLNDYKINYSIYIIQQNVPIQHLESANDDDCKGIEIYDEDNNSKKYFDQIMYFRNIINEYDNINKKLKISKYIENSNTELLNNLYIYFDKVNQYTNDILIKFFIEKDLTDNIVNDYCLNLNNLDIEFKEQYNLFNDEYNIINKLITKIKNKEDELLDKLEKENNNEYVNVINKKLDVIIEFDSIIYKINSGYTTDIENNKILDMIKILESL